MFGSGFPFALIFAASASVAVAQPVEVPDSGDKAVLFSFNGLGTLNLGEYEGGVGVKYFVESDLAVRGMLGFGVDNETTKGAVGYTDSTENTVSFGVGGAVEYHLPLASHVSPYVGGEILFMTSTETRTPSVFTGSPFGGPSAPSEKTTSTGFGLGGVAGVEYFFNRNISLAAEYQLGIAFNNYSNPGRNKFRAGFQTAGLTLAVYF